MSRRGLGSGGSNLGPILASWEGEQNGVGVWRRQFRADIWVWRKQFRADIGVWRKQFRTDIGVCRKQFRADIGVLGWIAG